MDESVTPAGLAPSDELLDDGYLLDALLEHSPDHLYFKDAQSRFLRVSRSLAVWMGLRDPMEAIGRSDSDFFAPEHAEKARVDEDLIVRTGRALVGIEEREVWPDGRETWVSTTKAPLRDRNGEVIGIFGMSRDITDRKAAEELVANQAAMLSEQAQMLRDLATRDELTGLLNRRGFFDAANEAIELARKSSRRSVVFFVDLDGLKQINDTKGHEAGDRALMVVATAVRELAAAGHVAGRIGGDEFCVLQTAGPADPVLDEAALQQAIARGAVEAGLAGLSATIGKVDGGPGDDLAGLVARSDRKMYSRKARRAHPAQPPSR